MMTEEKLKEKAKEAYVRSWAATDDSITEADIKAFVDSINLTDQEALRFFSDIEFMANQRVPDKLRWVTIPQRGAVAIDEAAKVFFRTLRVSEIARKQAIKQASNTAQEGRDDWTSAITEEGKTGFSTQLDRAMSAQIPKGAYYKWIESITPLWMLRTYLNSADPCMRDAFRPQKIYGKDDKK